MPSRTNFDNEFKPKATRQSRPGLVPCYSTKCTRQISFANSRKERGVWAAVLCATYMNSRRPDILSDLINASGCNYWLINSQDKRSMALRFVNHAKFCASINLCSS